jgi:hypothetical protein
MSKHPLTVIVLLALLATLATANLVVGSFGAGWTGAPAQGSGLVATQAVQIADGGLPEPTPTPTPVPGNPINGGSGGGY